MNEHSCKYLWKCAAWTFVCTATSTLLVNQAILSVKYAILATLIEATAAAAFSGFKTFLVIILFHNDWDDEDKK